jgi:ATP-binding cassette subfamily B protein
VLYVGKVLVDEVVRLSNQEGVLNFDTDLDTMILWVFLGLSLALMMSVNLQIIKLTNTLLGDLVSIRTSAQLIEHASKLDLYQFENPDFYDKLDRARQQNTERTLLMDMVFSQVQDVVTVSALIIALIAFSPWLVLLLVLVVLPVYFGEAHFNKKNYSLLRGWTPEQRELNYIRRIGTSDETVKEVKIFKLEKFISNRFLTLSDQYYQASKKISKNRTIFRGLFSLLSTTVYYIAYVFVLYQALVGTITIGTMTFLGGAFQRLQSVLEGSAHRFSQISDKAMYLQDFFDFLDMKPLIQSSEGSYPMPKTLKTGFEFENVSFTYHGTNKYALKNLSFKLNAGEKLALVGENGAGKTTIVKLIARLYTPTEGRILLDGIDIFDYRADEYAAKMGVIFQDYVRFMFTAKENIAVGNVEEFNNQTLIKSAAEKSLANTVIENLEHQYDQMLGKRFKGGVELSGGQWQKIALARAYMRDAQLVILDEPTAALDARSEYEVFLRFAELMHQKTAVIISHRFSTVRMADRILFLEMGEKREEGSHEELMTQGGKYAELFDLQAKGYL